MPEPTTDIRRPFFARAFLRIGEMAERKGGGEHRARMLAGVSGRVIEVGAGNGLNFPHYPETVAEVLAIEPEPLLREHAERAARDAPVKITVVPGVAESLPAEDKSCDAGIASLMLCSVPDPRAALEELYRVIKPGGELRFYEHVAARTSGLARVQRIFDRTFWPHVAGGCHSARDTESTIEMAGFAIQESEYFMFQVSRLGFHTAPHIVGRARRV